MNFRNILRHLWKIDDIIKHSQWFRVYFSFSCRERKMELRCCKNYMFFWVNLLWNEKELKIQQVCANDVLFLILNDKRCWLKAEYILIYALHSFIFLCDQREIAVNNCMLKIICLILFTLIFICLLFFNDWKSFFFFFFFSIEICIFVCYLFFFAFKEKSQ